MGGYLAKRLLELGVEVTGLVRTVKAVCPLSLYKLQDRVNIVRGSVTDMELIVDTFANFEVDTVFHLASFSKVKVCHQSPYACFESNVRGGYTIMEACRRAGIEKVVVASTDKVYRDKDRECQEDMAIGGVIPYTASKSCLDQIAQCYAHTYQTPVVITRCCNIYGGGDMNFNRLIPSKIRDAILNRPMTLYAGREHVVQEYIHISDAVAAYLLLAEKGENGQVYNVGSGEVHGATDIVSRIMRRAGRYQDLPASVGKTFKEPQGLWVNSSKIHGLGFKATVGIDKGLDRAFSWYCQWCDKGVADAVVY